MAEEIKFNWECLRRNQLYREEYLDVSTTEGFDRIDDIYAPDSPDLDRKLSDFCGKWNVIHPKDPDTKIRFPQDGSLFYRMRFQLAVTHLPPAWYIEIVGAKNALLRMESLMRQEGHTFEKALEQVRELYREAGEKTRKSQETAGKKFDLMQIDYTAPQDLILAGVKTRIRQRV